MHRILRTASLIAATAALSSLAGAAMAQDRTCRGTIGAVLADTVTVPPGASCALSGTRVRGDVIVNRLAMLRTDRAIILGSIKGDGARALSVAAQTRIAGSIEWKLSGGASVVAAVIDGDIKFEKNNGVLTATDNAIDGDIQAELNRGGFVVRSNVIQGNLKCKENVPAPVGGRNIVAGNKEGQCSRL